MSNTDKKDDGTSIVMSEAEHAAEKKEKDLARKDAEQDQITYRVRPNIYSSFDSKTGEFEYEVHLPGVNKKDVKLRVLPTLFDLKARRDQILFTETEYFPYEIDVNAIEAKYENGLLRMHGKLKNPLDDAVEIKLA